MTNIRTNIETKVDIDTKRVILKKRTQQVQPKLAKILKDIIDPKTLVNRALDCTIELKLKKLISLTLSIKHFS